MVFFALNKKSISKKIFYKMKFKNFIKFRRKSKVVHPQYFEAYSAGHTEKSTYKTVEDMPGPWPDLPFIGTSWVFSPFGPYSKDQALTKVREDFLSKYGTIYKEKLGGASIVSLHDSNHVELVMRSQGVNPMRIVNEANIYFRKSRPDLYKSVGLVDSTGEDWRSIRSKTSAPLLNPNLLTPYPEVFSNLTEEFVQVLKSEVNSSVGRASPRNVGVGKALGNESVGGTLDVRAFLYRFALEAIWQSSLGIELGALKSSPTEEVSHLILHSEILLNSIGTLSTSRPWWKLWPSAARLCPVSTFHKFCSSEETVFRLVSKYTRRVIKDISEEGDSETVVKPSILRHYLNVDELNPKDINTLIVDFIVAGISTTSYFLCLLLHRLGQEREIQTRLQEELDLVLGRRDAVITEDRLRSLTYLKAVLKEGFRLTPIIPGILKILPVDIVCDEYLIPANTPILCQMRAASRSTKYFSLPEDFIPERFLKNAESAEVKQLQKEVFDHRFLLLPFGFGPRVCIGKRLAEKEMLVFLAKILQNFSIRSEGDLELSNNFIIGPKGPVPLEFIPRS